jgi:hypothetical protein
MTNTEMHDGHTTGRILMIFINDEQYQAPDREMTGRELFALGGIPEGNHLFLDVPGPGDDRQIGLDDDVRLRPKMRFYDVPVGNFG